MSKKLKALLEAARRVTMTSTEVEEQRRSFAYGNTHFENERITKETIERAAENLRTTDAKHGRSLKRQS